MKLKLTIVLLALVGVVLAQEQVRNQEQLEEKVVLYWAAFVKQDYSAAYEMYPAYMRSEISYIEWLKILGFSEGQQNDSELRLVSVEIESIIRPNDPNFANLCEVFVRLRIESQDGAQEDGLVSNIWEMDAEGNWAPSMPLALGP